MEGEGLEEEVVEAKSNTESEQLTLEVCVAGNCNGVDANFNVTASKDQPVKGEGQLEAEPIEAKISIEDEQLPLETCLAGKCDEVDTNFHIMDSEDQPVEEERLLVAEVFEAKSNVDNELPLEECLDLKCDKVNANLIASKDQPTKDEEQLEAEVLEAEKCTDDELPLEECLEVKSEQVDANVITYMDEPSREVCRVEAEIIETKNYTDNDLLPEQYPEVNLNEIDANLNIADTDQPMGRVGELEAEVVEIKRHSTDQTSLDKCSEGTYEEADTSLNVIASVSATPDEGSLTSLDENPEWESLEPVEEPNTTEHPMASEGLNMAGPNAVNSLPSQQASAYIEQAKQILEAQGAGPLSLRSFLDKFEKHQSKEISEMFRDVCCHSALPGLLSTEDFIAVDTLGNSGILKFGLIAANKLRDEDRIKNARHTFILIATKEERAHFGRSAAALSNSILGRPDFFEVTSRKEFRLKPKAPVQFDSFFIHESDPEMSAVHKLTYFLRICNGSSSLKNVYHFCRKVLTTEEKMSLSIGTTEDLIKVLNTLDRFDIEGDSVFMSPCCRKGIHEEGTVTSLAVRATQDEGSLTLDGGNPEHESLEPLAEPSTIEYPVAAEELMMAGPDAVNLLPPQQAYVYIEQAKQILETHGAGVLSWRSFLEEFEKHQSKGISEMFQDACCHSALPGLLSTKDFIALDTPRNSGLLKLGLIAANRTLKKGKGKNPRHTFVLIATEKERDQFGRIPAAISESVLDMPDFFEMTKPTRFLLKTEAPVQFDSFFVHKKDPQTSATHKLTYFLSICNGSHTLSGAWKFCRQVLTGEENTFLSTKTWEGFVGVLESLDGFIIKDDTLVMSLPCCGPSINRMKETLAPRMTTDVECLDSDHGNLVCESMPLTEHLVRKHLDKERPHRSMSWARFKSTFLPNDEHADNTIAQFQQECFEAAKSLIITEDFVAKNLSFMRCNLKLQLILEIRERSKMSPEMTLDELESQLKEITFEYEMEEIERNGQSFEGHLLKFPLLFSVNSCNVSQGCNVLKFPSFFAREEQDATGSVVHKLNYFRNLSGGRCTSRQACKFLLRHIHPEPEQLLVNSEEMAMSLVRRNHEWNVTLPGESGIQQATLYSGSATNSPSYASGLALPYEIHEHDPSKPLTDNCVLAHMKSHGYQNMNWDEFISKFLSNDENADSVIRHFLQKRPGEFPGPLIITEDFVSQNSNPQRSHLKLQLLVQIKKGLSPTEMTLGELEKQFGEIATKDEIALKDKCRSLKQYLSKNLQEQFCITGQNVEQRPMAVRFLSFFAMEGEDPTRSVLQKLKYFVGLCGGYCDKELACKFLLRHIHPAEEKMLVDSEEAATAFIQNYFDGRLWEEEVPQETVNGSSAGTGSSTTQNDNRGHETVEPSAERGVVEPPTPESVASENECQECDALESLTEQRIVEYLQTEKRKHPIRWGQFKSKFLSEDKHAKSAIAQFKEQWGNRASRSLIITADFVARNLPFVRTNLKLQLILEIRKRSKVSSAMTLDELTEQFLEIATHDEIAHTKYGCLDFNEYLSKFPPVFSITEGNVKLTPGCLKLSSFFAKQGMDAASSVAHKLNYFVCLTGGHCVKELALRFLQRHIHLTKEQLLVDTEEKALNLIRNHSDGYVTIPKEGLLGTLPDKRERPTEDACEAVKECLELETILKQSNRPLTWKDLQKLHPANHTKLGWEGCLKEVRGHYLQATDDEPYIQGMEYLSLNTPYDRGFLKLCLLVRLNRKIGSLCHHIKELGDHFRNIASYSEVQPFQGDLESHLETFPSVFEHLVENFVMPGLEMFDFEEFFTCKEHGKEKCLPCCLLEFLNICGGVCHYREAYHFMEIVMCPGVEQEVLEKADFEELLDSCTGVNRDTDNNLFTALNYRVATRQGTSFSSEEGPTSQSNDQRHNPSQPLTEDCILAHVKSHRCRHMSWDKFKSTFSLDHDQCADVAIAQFLQKRLNKFSRSLLITEDFVSRNLAFQRRHLKLQLILEIRKRSARDSPEMTLDELDKEFQDIASDDETFQRVYCQDLKEYLSKYPQVPISVHGGKVEQGTNAVNFPTFFTKEGQDATVSVLHKLNYFVNLCGGHCSGKMACNFLLRHILPVQEKTLVDSEEKAIYFMQNYFDGPLSRQHALQCAGTERTLRVSSEMTETDKEQISEVEAILLQEKHPITWTKLRDLRPKTHEKRSWKNCLKKMQKKKSTDQSFIQGRDYISLNAPFDRGFLKLCLLVQLSMKCDDRYQIQELSDQFRNVGSTSEQLQFQGDLECHLLKFPLMFQRVEEGFVMPGPRMFSFDMFSKCTRHKQRRCRLCCLLEFLSISGGKCHLSEAHHFMRIAARSWIKKKLGDEVVDKLIDNCKDVYKDIDMNLFTTWSYRTATREGALRETMERTLMPNTLTEHQSDSTSVSSGFKDLSSTSCSPESLQSSPSFLELGSQKCPPMNSLQDLKIKTTVQVIENHESLANYCRAIMAHSRPIISVSCSKDALVVVDWFGAGFVVPIPEGGRQIAGKNVSTQVWSILWGLFQNQNLVSVTFDCGIVGRLLLEKLNLPLRTVFDVQTAVELINSTSTDDSSSILHGTLADLCHLLEIPGPDQIDPSVIGETKMAPDQLCKMIQETRALVPGVYSRIFQKLGALGVLSHLHGITQNKLQTMYMTRTDGHLPEELNTEPSGRTKTIIAGNVSTAPSFGTSQEPLTHTETYLQSYFQNSDTSSNRENSADTATSAKRKCHGVNSSFSSSSRSLSSGSSIPLPQNDISQFSYSAIGVGSIVPAGVGYRTNPSEGFMHSFQKALHSNPSFSQPLVRANSTGSSTQSIQSCTSIPVSQYDNRQFPGYSSSHKGPSLDQASIAASWAGNSVQQISTNLPIPVGNYRIREASRNVPKSPSFSQMPWMTNSSQSDAATNGHLVNKHPVHEDWFAGDIEGNTPVEAQQLCDMEGGKRSEDITTKAMTSSNMNVSGLSEELLHLYADKNKESISLLFDILGEDIKATFGKYVRDQDSQKIPAEIVLDLGRHAEARFHRNDRNNKPVCITVSSKPITKEDLARIEASDALTGFDEQHCCGIEGTLHSVRGVPNRKKKLIGLTIKIGLPMLGCADMMYDIARDGKSTLIVGYQGVGKTTLLRELARCLSDNEKKKVVVVDTYNEIAGDCDVPHFSIGSARRLQVPEHQHDILLESARNHNPEVIIIDQIESREDVDAVTRLRKGGIQIIAGANRVSVQSLVSDNIFSQIFQVGDSVLDETRSLDSAGALGSVEFKSPFQTLVEMKETDWWYIHDTEHTRGQMSVGQPYTVQEWLRTGSGGENNCEGKTSIAMKDHSACC